MSEYPAAAASRWGDDKSYDTHDFVEACRTFIVTSHMARNLPRAGGSALDAVSGFASASKRPSAG